MAVILSARRTAVVPRGGAFARLSVEDMAAPVLLACLADAGVGAPDEVICSNAIGLGGNPARRIALAAGLPQQVGGLTIDRQCAGGLDAILLARALVDSGQARLVLAGGVESYTRRPLRFRTDPDGGAPQPYEQAPFTPWPDRDPDMAEAAALLAEVERLSRAEQEAFAIESHAKALARSTWPEIVPLAGQGRDAFARALTPAIAARAKPIAGTVTAATAAVAADAAAFCLVASDDLWRAGALRILAGSTLGDDPSQPGLAPVPAIRAALTASGTGAADLAQVEVMEAYAVQAMACVTHAGLNPATVNPGGGALSRGHPIGASGAILAVRLFHDLRRGRGLAAIASAGGIGSALVVERP
ncbi:thiolase family protein [Thioclava sp. FR2]|uniref:thiolase family protein n=1 Tax=Thioclava sp. FR2 TaxID=3445780 RepID=UPI003EBB6A05